MLVMRRRIGERLVIGEGIEIEILEARANSVKLGITAPGSVTIVRKEAQLVGSTNVTAAESMQSSGIESVLRKLVKQKPDEKQKLTTGVVDGSGAALP